MTAESMPERDWLGLLQAVELSQALTQRDDEHREVVRQLLIDFLHVVDSLDRIIRLDDAGVTGSLETLRRQLFGVFERAGVHFSESVGKPFDPERQEAVEVRSEPGCEAGLVLEELRRGCEWNRTVLRTAHVVVSGA